MNGIDIGIPKPSGYGGVPEPFNLNDVLVWKALICKFICNEHKDRFSKSSFLEALIKGEVGLIKEAYDKNEMQKAIIDNNHPYGHLIKFCLDDMVMKGLFEKYGDIQDLDYNSYHVMDKLKLLCPQILKYDFAGIDELVKSNNAILRNAATEIYQHENHSVITNLLKRLAVVNQMPLDEALRYVDKGTLGKLIENGSVTLYLDNKIAISYIGKQIIAGQF